MRFSPRYSTGFPLHRLWEQRRGGSPSPACPGSREASVTLAHRAHRPRRLPGPVCPTAQAILKPTLKEWTLQGPPPPAPPYKTPESLASAAKQVAGASTPQGSGRLGSTDGAWELPPSLSSGHSCCATETNRSRESGLSKYFWLLPVASQHHEED